MIHDVWVESAGSPNSARASGNAGSIRSIDRATIPMQLAISPTNSRCENVDRPAPGGAATGSR